MSDLTRGNLVFGSLNSKRSRVSLVPQGEGGRVAVGERAVRREEDDEAKLEGNVEVACVLCVWAVESARGSGNDSGSGGG